MRRALILLLFATACGEAAPIAPPAPDRDGGVPVRDGGVPVDSRYRLRLDAVADYGALTSTHAPDVKYLFNVDGVERAAPLDQDCYFMNMRQYDWHLAWLQSFEAFRTLGFEAYVSLTQRSGSRQWWAGGVQLHPGVRHPVSDRLGVFAYAVYAEPSNLTVDDIAEVDGLVERCAPFAKDLRVFVPAGPWQKSLVVAEQQRLAELGVAFLMPEQLISGLTHVAYSEGEGYGTLRVVPAGERLDDYGPRDIVVVESAPNDISVVAGLITKDPQNQLSHTNLRLVEKGIPNVAVPRIYESAVVEGYADQLVRLVVAEDRFTLEPANLEDAEAFWARTRPTVPTPRADLTVTGIGDYAAIGSEAADAYGAKAANIAELDAVLPSEHRPGGFGIPFSRYVEHVTANGIDARIEAFLADPRSSTDAIFKRGGLKTIRDAIRDAPIAPSLIDEVEQRVGALERIRFRSSTNVEDLDALTGAGLYDSKSGCIADDRDDDELGPSLCVSAEERAAKEGQLAARRAELSMHPDRTYLSTIIADLEGDLNNERTVARAIRAVWASLWNVRAFDERAYYGIDHRDAYMGIAVNPSFVLERASAVAITELNVDEGAPLYRLNAQTGSESVVRPDDPTAIAEALTFRRENDAPADVEVQVESSRLPAGERVFTEAELATIASLLFDVHDHFAANVYAHLAPLALDVELKHTQDGRIVIKQVRPFVSTGP
ncbi:MAG: PEP/pyruvate-binding domain-containing protein [Deltaproteobacteria bacterium]|jgi:pyruvate,water dikinase